MSSRCARRLAAAALLATLGGAALGATQGQGGGRTEDDYEAANLAAGDLWAGWAAELLLESGPAGVYVPEAAAGGRVQWWRSRKRRPQKLLRLIDKTVAELDEIVPEPKEPFGGVPRPARAVVLLELDNAEGYASVTRHLANTHPYLAGWAESAAGGVGFVLEEPLAAAWRLEVPEIDVWNPENELVNRLVQGLLIERCGRLPTWLSMGLAWHVELALCKDVYCFPYRDGFVGKREHEGWASTLSARIAQRGEARLAIEELSDWKRGTYDDERAALSWAAAALLAKHYPEELLLVLERFASVHARDGRVTNPDGSWQAIPEYEIPAETQLAILDEALGADFLEELQRFGRNARSYRRRR